MSRTTHLGDLLSALLDGELSGSERSSAKQHLAECVRCRSELAEAEWARGRVRSLPALEAPPGIVPAPPLRRRFSRRIQALTGSIAGVALVVAGFAVASVEPAPAFDVNMISDRHTARVVVDPGISTIRAPGGAP